MSHAPGYSRCAMKRTCLVLAVLTTLFVAAPAQAAIPHSEITLFSDFGHDIVDGSEWRWTSDDEDLDVYVEIRLKNQTVVILYDAHNHLKWQPRLPK